MTDRTYRVWVEKHERGWVTITAPSEQSARDRAAHVARYRLSSWEPDTHIATPGDVELVTGPKAKP